ncbi:MAG TPA: 7TM diverse intracellular signaling domain-containing protein [Turneriella sp.]|nr:7TM diverse intracellular signaling domain-containing protein [Turneriella sp.]
MRFILISLLLVSSTALAAASDPAPLVTGKQSLGRWLEFRRETVNGQSITEIAKHAFETNLTGKEAINFGYTKDHIWVRFSVTNVTAAGLWYLRLGTLVDKASLYEEESPGKWRERKLGRFEPFSQRELTHRDLVFVLSIAPQTTKTFYLEIASAGNVTVQLDITDARTFAAADHDAQFAFGLYFGLMLIMVGYNLFLFLSTRELTYLWYVSYVLFFTLLHLSINGYVAEYLWPRHLPVLPFLTPLFISVSGVFSVLFTRQILGLRGLRGHMETLSGILLGLFLIAVLAAPLAPYTVAMRAATYSTLIAILGLTYCGTRRLLQGQKSARFFLLGWLALYTGIAAMLLRNLGILPHNFFTAYAMQIFSAAEVTLFSLALGDRLNQLREDSLKLQQVRKELDIARKMQLALVPPVVLTAPRVDIAHRYIPMLDVGGDFMDIRITEDGISMFIGDVSGHGIGAAMIATTMKLTLDTEGDRHRSPNARMQRLRSNVGELPDSAFVTACSVYFTPLTGELTIASAGHPPLIIYHARTQSCTRYKPRGMPLGVKDSSPEYTLEYAAVEAGDIVLLYTDGLIEQGVFLGQEFGLDRIERILCDLAKQPAHEISESLLAELEKHAGRLRTQGFDDDIAFVIMKITGDEKKLPR